ncbi:MAG: hypothetical protein WA421_00080 [Nitrososphaeraceae archaeon]
MSNFSEFFRFYPKQGLLLSNNIAFRFARPKMRAAFKPAGPPPIIAQSNRVSILFQVQFFRHRIVKAGCR